ncbi:MAG TPA: TonB-dependent receptor [Saprospiraceae bacterium]|nr:TonB-dependent receptor [Saprospiraceae bacterium]HMQ83923.1 TonB-dependent receptor [Saprospiraceae bacterium]
MTKSAAYKLILIPFLTAVAWLSYSQNASLSGIVSTPTGETLGFANIALEGTTLGGNADENGRYTIQGIPAGDYKIMVSFLGYETIQKRVVFKAGERVKLDFTLDETTNTMNEVVVTGTMKEVNRLESPVPVEVYTPVFFKKNPTPNIYEALQNVNGVRPQLNCQVCNTGDIHINGLEGPYTMVLIDGMPIVSSLATVYGLSGIPNALVERMEIVKGPASSLYGSEAIGGLINIITKSPEKAPIFSADVMGTTWAELNADLGIRFNLGNTVSVLTGINYFHYDEVLDKNKDNFTDVTIQERISIFQKWRFKRQDSRLFTLAGRYYWEDRWGGELDWTPTFRGGDEIYGEAITTKRWELMGQYELPVVEHLLFSFSFNSHHQNSVYGDSPYLADQKIGFGQLSWDKKLGHHDLLAGAAIRYTFYDDNTPATGGDLLNPGNRPDETWLPGIFVQDEITFSPKQKVLLGLRYDYHDEHGSIFTPRFAYKWGLSKNDIFRVNAGTGFRVVNLFAEDHAALTGAREVVVAEQLRPEQSFNVNVNYTRKSYMDHGGLASVELSAWYTYFANAIFPDYETNANQIIYKNLDGSAISKGFSLNADLTLPSGLSFLLGASLMDVSKKEGGIKARQILTERFSGTWSVSYKFLGNKMAVDYTGNVYGPMLLPLLGELDPRPAESPWWSIQNIQLTYKSIKHVEVYAGVKNLLNWTPWKNQDQPIIARSFDPFDSGVLFDAEGNVLATPENPYALSFDPSYVYAPNQGIRGFLGFRYALNR